MVERTLRKTVQVGGFCATDKLVLVGESRGLRSGHRKFRRWTPLSENKQQVQFLPSVLTEVFN